MPTNHAAPLGRMRVAVTGSDTPPTSAEWDAAEDVADIGAVSVRLRELAAQAIADDVIAFVWAGFDGLTVGGSSHAERKFRVMMHVPPPGWPDPERERQEAVVADWNRHRELQAEAAKIAKAASAAARKATYTPLRDTSMDAIR